MMSLQEFQNMKTKVVRCLRGLDLVWLTHILHMELWNICVTFQSHNVFEVIFYILGPFNVFMKFLWVLAVHLCLKMFDLMHPGTEKNTGFINFICNIYVKSLKGCYTFFNHLPYHLKTITLLPILIPQLTMIIYTFWCLLKLFYRSVFSKSLWTVLCSALKMMTWGPAAQNNCNAFYWHCLLTSQYVPLCQMTMMSRIC